MSDDDLDKISTPRGEARSMKPLPADMVNTTNSPPGTGAGWFGPQQPMHPIAPPEVAGRAFDFMPGWNLATLPRFGEEIGFKELRALASAYDPVALIISRRLDQMTRLPWCIRAKDDDGSGKRQKSVSPQMRSTIREVERFFKNPTADLSFRPWLRVLLTDLLVLDAPSIYLERDNAGNLVSLSPVDGGTIKRIIDDHGRTPRPFNWDGEPFTWLGGQTVGPENLHDLGFKIVDGLVYPPAYQQVLKGLSAVNMTTWDLLYRPMNPRSNHAYGNSPVAQIVTTVSIATRRAMGQLQYFTEGSQPDAFYSLPESYTPDQVMRLQDWFDNLYSGNLANRRKLKFMPAGTANPYHATREPPLKSEFDEWLTRIVCFAFSYPPQAFVALSNRSTAEQHEETAQEEGLEPLKNWFADLANGVIEREFSEEVEFAWNSEKSVDPKIESEILVNLVSNGILSINQARERLGEEPSDDPAADQLGVKTQTGFIPIARGEVVDEIDDDGDAEKLAKGAIVMLPPAGSKPAQRFTIGKVTYIPNSKGQLIVPGDEDVAALEAAGWRKSNQKRR